MKKSGMVCSFCLKDREEVLYLITGNDAYICDECTDLAADIIKEERAMLKEKRNVPTTSLSFSAALNMLKEGRKVCRAGWNGYGMWLELVASDEVYIHKNILGPLLPWIGMKTADGGFVPWLASQTDMLSEDWCVTH